MTITRQASARSNLPYGYKAIILHSATIARFSRSEVVARRGHHGIGKNFASRTEAITYAQAVIDYRKEKSALFAFCRKISQETGRRPSLEKAKKMMEQSAWPRPSPQCNPMK